MITWQEIDKAVRNGSLDGAKLPFLLECRRVLDGLVNAQGGSDFHKLRECLYSRVNGLIERLEQIDSDSTSAESERRRHEEKLALDREAITASKEALSISKGALAESKTSNETARRALDESKKANTTSAEALNENRKANRRTNRWSIFALLISLAALGLSAYQYFSDSRNTHSKATHTGLLTPLPPKTELRTPPTSNAPLSNSLSAVLGLPRKNGHRS